MTYRIELARTPALIRRFVPAPGWGVGYATDPDHAWTTGSRTEADERCAELDEVYPHTPHRVHDDRTTT